MSIQPRYIARNPSELDGPSIQILRTSDNASFLASPIPNTLTKAAGEETETPLADVLLPSASISLSLILNHPNIISLVDITQNDTSSQGLRNLIIFEDMTAGSLSALLPSVASLPSFTSKPEWEALAAQNYHRPSLPESLCWHVLRSISRALLWLHHGVKETAGVSGEWNAHDPDWQPILIRDVSPGQIWFKKPKGKELYGECKLGGFANAKVTGVPGGRIARAESAEGLPFEKTAFWAPEVEKPVVHFPWTRASEIWSLGAVVYCMMTGIPPPRFHDYDWLHNVIPRAHDYNWQISRMNDKGFSLGIREIVQDMLSTNPRERPIARRLMEKVEVGWREWRVSSKEGREYVDVEDELLGQGRGLLV